MRSDERVGRVGLDETERVGGVLARAFAADPLTVHLFPDPRERARLSPRLFAALARYDCLFGKVERLDGFLAVATWLPPGEGIETPERLAAAGLDRLDEDVGPVAPERQASFFAAIEHVHEQAVRGPHWYLRLLGVEPSAQGRGLGAALLRHGLARADASGAPCFLETFQERNVAFYLRHGFELAAEGVERQTGIRYWGFVRAPVPPGL